MSIGIMNLINVKPLLPKGWEIRLSPRFLSYRPSFEIQIETPRYFLKTANKMSELLEVFELRHQIFLEDTSGDEGLDVDNYDSICDHIIILDKETNQIVGTYRIISSLFSDSFYSQQEFSLDRFLQDKGEKMELGRACIHHGHRNGLVIDLLWKGICRYIKLTDSRYLFGCSSIKTTDHEVAKMIYHYLKNEKLVREDFGVDSIGKYEMDFDKQLNFNEEQLKPAKAHLPSLLRSYFSAGAYVHGRPALDIEFDCIDFFTILDVENMSSSYKKRYMGLTC